MTHRTRSKPAKCAATNQDGTACSARPRDGRPYCQWHDPELLEWRRQNAIKGGKSNSHENRARRLLEGSAQDMATVKSALMMALAKVGLGQMEPAVGQSMAAIARAIVAVSGAAELEARIAQLEELAQERAS